MNITIKLFRTKSSQENSLKMLEGEYSNASGSDTETSYLKYKEFNIQENDDASGIE